MKIEDEILAMNKTLREPGQESENADEEKPGGEPKDAKPPAEEPPKEEAKVSTEEKPPEEPKVEDKKPAEETKEPEPAPVVDEKDKTIEELRAKLAESEAARAKSVEKPPEKVTEKTPAPKIEEQDFVGNLDMDELSRDPREFNKLMNKVYQKAVTDTRAAMEAGLAESLPSIVSKNVVLMQGLQKAREDFFTENDDLAKFPQVVATVFDEIVAKDPKKEFGKVMEEVGPEARKRLNLPPKQAQSKEPEPKKDTPRPPKKGGNVSRPSDQPKASPLQADIESMNKSIGR